ncbi:MAG: hypothetical protein JXA99_06490 [Candidatus Lokiarchaeota archaeon]|nr:hypothetical protein [Candidatus Lokiarchaeota archaeon]
MKKSALFLLSIIAIGTIVGVLSYFIIFYKPSTQTTTKYVRIYVNSTIYGSISTEISQYEQDVKNQGYLTDVISWSNTDVVQLKGDLINAYNNSFVGAVFIGKIPYALYDNLSISDTEALYPCDLFLMDLDGLWLDLNPTGDGIFDGHTTGTGDVYPEIWIGRINPECLNNLGFSYIQAYKDYFKKNHDYRTGSLTRPDQALLYIDDDWANIQSSMYNDFNSANCFSSITNIYNLLMTTDIDYENNQITNASYKWVHLMAHSWAYRHQWGPGGTGSEGYTTNTEINSIVTQPLFYNLFSCYACDISYTNNMGTQYLFSNNTLAVVGSTKSGGMWMISSFYSPLGQGKTIGESFRLWWWNSLHGPLDKVSRGLTILGDPLLTI